MKTIEFEHKSYGKMITTVENYIEYTTFDAIIDNDDNDNIKGDSFSVYKEDCFNVKVVEI